MTVIHIGATLEIATGVPAAFTKAGYEALTWVAIGGLIEAPSFSTTHSDINVPSMAGRTKIMKGAEVGQPSSIVWETIEDDNGQAALIAAARARGEYSLRITLLNATDCEYASGIIKDFVRNKPTNASFDGGTVNFVANYVPVVATVPA